MQVKYNISNRNYNEIGPELGDDKYYSYRSEVEVDPGAEFNPLEFFEPGPFEEDFNNHHDYIDLMIGIEPVTPALCGWVSRKDTYEKKNWSKIANITRPCEDQLCDAGFYYTGVEDCVQCFWCGLSLKSWEPEDDPWEEHTRFKPRCPWIMRCRGPFFIRKVLKNTSSRLTFDSEKVALLKDLKKLRGMILNLLN